MTLPTAAPAPPNKSGRKGDDEKGRGGGGFIIARRRARLKTAWHGSSTRIAKRQAGRTVAGVVNAAARIMADLARALKDALAPHLSPVQIALLQREEADRQTEAQQAELAQQLREIDDRFEEQRRLQAEADYRRPYGLDVDAAAAIRATVQAHAWTTPVSDSLDYFWQQHWQNDIDTSSAEIPDTEPRRDFSGDVEAWGGPCLEL